MRKIIIIGLLLIVAGTELKPQPVESGQKRPLVQLCLIIDVSPSMQGLLLQTQSQLWGILDYTSNFQLKGRPAEVEIAVLIIGGFYENGTTTKFKIVSDFTKDFEGLADKLFLLQLGGGEEYFGQGIQVATNELSWHERSDFKSIIVAGNESFAQGPVNYEEASRQALKKGIIVNTIFCGNYGSRPDLHWKEASEHGGGKFAIIEQDQDSLNQETPFDDNILELYQKFQATFDLSMEKTQIALPPRGMISPIYRNMILNRMRNFTPPDDVISRFEKNDWDLNSIDFEDLPDELKQLERKELQVYLIKMSQKRTNALDGLKLYQKKIEEFLNIKLGKRSNQKTLDSAVKDILYVQLKAKGFLYEKIDQ